MAGASEVAVACFTPPFDRLATCGFCSDALSVVSALPASSWFGFLEDTKGRIAVRAFANCSAAAKREAGFLAIAKASTRYNGSPASPFLTASANSGGVTEACA